MKFSRLRVVGFKSFVEPAEFVIEPGLTGVVGPNGCGKSNLVEALRWVMGESSYKNMRASGMDDVIFSGSLNRPARNTAEVSLAIDNTERKAPAAFNDSEQLEVTRRIEREAGSIYRINGRDVRARDVQLLFADASTGAHSPAMVGQGKVGELIAAKPQDRRALLEEAAGISGLHNRRHEAELRLGAAEQNLGRIEDVIAEIEAQLEGLKRQARQAVRYRNLSGEIRKAEAGALHLRWLGATAGLTEAEAHLADAVTQANDRAAEQARAAVAAAEAAAALPGLRDAAARAGAALQRMVVAREQLDAEEARVAARLGDLDRRLIQLADDIAREERMITDNRSILGRLDEEERGLRLADEAMTGRRAAAIERRTACEASLAESERSLTVLTGELAEITARRKQFESAEADAGTRAAKLRAEIGRVAQELLGLDASSIAPEIVDARRDALSAAETTLTLAEEGAASAEARSVAARDAAAGARQVLNEAQQVLARLDAEAAALTAILARRTEGWTPVIDQVKVAAGYEMALGAAFADDLDAPADGDAPAHWRTIDAQADEPALPEGIGRLAAYVEAPVALARRLAHTGLISRDDGMRLQPGLRPGQQLVSREGDLWRWDGFVAAAEAPSAAAQRLANRNRLTVLEGEAQASRGVVDERRDALSDGERAKADADEAERAAREASRSARRHLDQSREELLAAEREIARTAAQRSALAEAQARLATSIDEAETVLAEARRNLSATPAPESLSAALAQVRESVRSNRAAMAEAAAAVDSLVREAEMRTARLSRLAVERQGWQERIANAESQIAILAARRGEAAAEQQQLREEPAKIEARRRALLSETASAEALRAEAADRLAAGETILAAADKTARAALDLLAEARERRGREEERVVAARSRLDEVAERINELLSCTPEETFALSGLKPEAPLPQLGDIEARLERYRQERERLGAVNLRAEAEATEVAERRDAMVKERDDLIAAIQRLRQGIGSLNREGRERLLAAFTTVNGHFQRLFTHLFGGGEAELQLTESDDPLQAGLEIVARPPGKKPQIMTLLSGGEQALTALSLIFAVFLTNPAPICVLDEVDAPLDDANVERFCNLLEEMTRQTETRFVAITHNPITMSRMNRLFGVTMAERGVSQLVSVDLETAERFLEAV